MYDPPIDNMDGKAQADECLKIALDEMASASAGHPPSLSHVRNVAGHALERIEELEASVFAALRKNGLPKIGKEIRMQDNAATSHPMFLVQERYRVYGVDIDYGGTSVWIDLEGEEADENESDRLSLLALDDEIDDEWTLTGYIDRWEFVTACFTRKACEEFIEANRHNLTDPRVYVASAHRNEEWKAVRTFLTEDASR